MEERDLDKVKGFLQRLVFLLNSVILYSIDHPKTKEILFEPYKSLRDILYTNKKIIVGTVEDKIIVEEKNLRLPELVNEKFISLLKELKIDSIAFKEGVTEEEWKNFIRAISSKSEEIEKTGGIDNLFKELKLNNISVNEVCFIKVPKEEGETFIVKQKIERKIVKNELPAVKQDTEKNKKETIKPKLILIVEDDEGMRELFREVVKKCGFTSLEARDGLSALDLIKNRSDIDLIILDIKLPKMHGLDIIDNLKKMQRIIPIIVCTAYTHLKDDLSVQFYPNVIAMNKPISLSELEKNLKEMTR